MSALQFLSETHWFLGIFEKEENGISQIYKQCYDLNLN